MTNKKLIENSNTAERKNNLIKITTGILIIFILVFSEVSAEEVNMLGDVRVTNATSYSRVPSLAIDSNNNVHISWEDDRDGNYEIYYKKYDNNGNALTGDVRVTNDTDWYVSPSLAIDSNNNVHISWYDDWKDDGIYEDIYYKKLDNNGNALTGDVRVTNTAGDSWAPSLAIDSNNNVHIVWHDYRVGNWEIYYKKYDNNGNALTGDVRVTNATLDSFYPSLAIDSNNNVHISWFDNRDGDEEIYYKKLDNNGNALTGDVRVTNATSYSRVPSLAIDSNNNVHIAWYDNRDGNSEIYYKKYDNNGNALTGDVRVTNAALGSLSPSLAVDTNNNVHIAWSDRRDEFSYGIYSEIYYKKLDNNGNALTGDVRVTNVASYSTLPSLAVDTNNNVHIVWHDYRDGNWEIYYTKIWCGGGKPDLSPQITPTPTANQNHLTHIPITINNYGDTTAPELSAVKVNIKITFNNNIIKEETRTVNMLNKNSETLYDFTFTAANAGTYNISVFVDSDNIVLESDENNNKIDKSILVFGSCSSDAECSDGDDKTGDYCVNGRCVNFGFLSGKLIKPMPDVNEATLDTTVHFYYSVDGVSGYCKNAGGTIGKEYDNSEKAYKKIPDIPGAGCGGLEVYMNVKNPSNNVEIVKSVLGVNGISDVAVKFDEFGGVGTYEVWVKNMTIIDSSGNRVDYEFSGLDHYEFDVKKEDFELSITVEPEVSASIAFLSGDASLPRSIFFDYRGNYGTSSNNDILDTDAGIQLSEELKVGVKEDLSIGVSVGEGVSTNIACLGGTCGAYVSAYDLSRFRFGKLDDVDNRERFYVGALSLIDTSGIIPNSFFDQYKESYVCGVGFEGECAIDFDTLGGSGFDLSGGAGAGVEYAYFPKNENEEVCLWGNARSKGELSLPIPKLADIPGLTSTSGGLSGKVNEKVCGVYENKDLDEMYYSILPEIKAGVGKKTGGNAGVATPIVRLGLGGSVEGGESAGAVYGGEVKIRLDKENIGKLTSDSTNFMKSSLSNIQEDANPDVLIPKILEDIENTRDLDLTFSGNYDVGTFELVEISGDISASVGLSTGSGINIGTKLAECELSTESTQIINRDLFNGFCILSPSQFSKSGCYPVYEREAKLNPLDTVSITSDFVDEVFDEDMIIEAVNNKLDEIRDEIKKQVDDIVLTGCSEYNPYAASLGLTQEELNELCKMSWEKTQEIAKDQVTNSIIWIKENIYSHDLHIHVVDEYGREIYFNYSSGEYVNNIPGAFILNNISILDNTTNTTVREIIFLPEDLEFGVYVDAGEAQNLTESYELSVATFNNNLTFINSTSENITQNQTIQYSINFVEDNVTGNMTISMTKNEEICGNGICNASANETIQSCAIDCDTIPPVIHSFNVSVSDNTTALKKIKITANVTDNAVTPLVFVNVTSLTGNGSELMELQYNETAGLYELELLAYRSDIFNLTPIAYDNIKKSPVKSETQEVVVKINISKIYNYLDALNITLPYNLTFYQDGNETDGIEGWRNFNLTINLTNFVVEFTNISADINPLNLPEMYAVKNVKINETPSGQDILIKDEMFYANQFSADLFFGINATYEIILKMKKPSNDFDVMKCDAILFGECVNPQMIPQQNYSIINDWIIMNISSFSGYGPVDNRPDIEPISLVYTPQYPEIDQNVSIFSVIENLGLGNATEVNISLFVDDIYENSKIIDLHQSSQETINFTWNALEGIHNLTIKVDPNNELNESDDTNNEITVEIAVFECRASSVCNDNQFCNDSHKCQNLTCEDFEKPFNHNCYHECDLNHDGIITHDYNDLMHAYKCFLGIKNCNNYYQNWDLIKQEYNCFTGNNN